MKILHASTVVIALILLQACSSQPKQSSILKTEDTINDEKAGLVKITGNTGISQNLSVPEAQIIRELYQSGCLIEDIELDRRTQHMRISCANDNPYRSSI